MVRVKNDDATLDAVIQTTTNSTPSDTIVVNVSIPVSAADGHEVHITLIPRANRQVEVHTERMPIERVNNVSIDEVPVTPAVSPVDGLRPQISRLNLGDQSRSPVRRNNTVMFDMASPTAARHSTPATPASDRHSRWANAVDVSDASDDDDETPLVPVYPPPHGGLETPHRDQRDGRKYYVVTKGKKIGVFYAHWNAIASICMRNQGGEYTWQPSYNAAKSCWKATPRADRQIIGN